MSLWQKITSIFNKPAPTPPKTSGDSSSIYGGSEPAPSVVAPSAPSGAGGLVTGPSSGSASQMVSATNTYGGSGGGSGGTTNWSSPSASDMVQATNVAGQVGKTTEGLLVVTPNEAANIKSTSALLTAGQGGAGVSLPKTDVTKETYNPQTGLFEIATFGGKGTSITRLPTREELVQIQDSTKTGKLGKFVFGVDNYRDSLLTGNINELRGKYEESQQALSNAERLRIEIQNKEEELKQADIRTLTQNIEQLSMNNMNEEGYWTGSEESLNQYNNLVNQYNQNAGTIEEYRNLVDAYNQNIGAVTSQTVTRGLFGAAREVPIIEVQELAPPRQTDSVFGQVRETIRQVAMPLSVVTRELIDTSRAGIISAVGKSGFLGSISRTGGNVILGENDISIIPESRMNVTLPYQQSGTMLTDPFGKMYTPTTEIVIPEKVTVKQDLPGFLSSTLTGLSFIPEVTPYIALGKFSPTTLKTVFYGSQGLRLGERVETLGVKEGVKEYYREAPLESALATSFLLGSISSKVAKSLSGVRLTTEPLSLGKYKKLMGYDASIKAQELAKGQRTLATTRFNDIFGSGVRISKTGEGLSAKVRFEFFKAPKLYEGIPYGPGAKSYKDVLGRLIKQGFKESQAREALRLYKPKFSPRVTLSGQVSESLFTGKIGDVSFFKTTGKAKAVYTNPFTKRVMDIKEGRIELTSGQKVLESGKAVSKGQGLFIESPVAKSVKGGKLVESRLIKLKTTGEFEPKGDITIGNVRTEAIDLGKARLSFFKDKDLFKLKADVKRVLPTRTESISDVLTKSTQDIKDNLIITKSGSLLKTTTSPLDVKVSSYIKSSGKKVDPFLRSYRGLKASYDLGGIKDTSVFVDKVDDVGTTFQRFKFSPKVTSDLTSKSVLEAVKGKLNLQPKDIKLPKPKTNVLTPEIKPTPKSTVIPGSIYAFGQPGFEQTAVQVKDLGITEGPLSLSLVQLQPGKVQIQREFTKVGPKIDNLKLDAVLSPVQERVSVLERELVSTQDLLRVGVQGRFAQLDKISVVQKQRVAQKQLQKQLQRQLQKQSLNQLNTFAPRAITSFRPPKITKLKIKDFALPTTGSSRLIKRTTPERKQLVDTSAYDVLTRVKGKEKLVASRLTKSAALDIGAATTLFGGRDATSLSASIILRRTKGKPIKVGTRGEFGKYRDIFREGKVKPTGAELVLVQKETRRLLTPTERKQIVKSRRNLIQ
jgi:hypothetical protein